MKLIKEDKQYKGTRQSVFASVYRDCESKRFDTVLWITIDFRANPVHFHVDSFSVEQFAKAIILASEQSNESLFLDIQKKFHNAIAKDPDVKATLLQIEASEVSLLHGEIDMTPESFVDCILNLY